jgi:single-stranded-DNA-specific exonuclease
MTPQLRRRAISGTPSGWPDAVHVVLQQIYAARGVLTPEQVEHRLARMLSPQALGGMPQAIEILVEAIRDDWRIVIAGDYDCDGATGTAVAVRGLRMLGAKRVSYAVPHRFIHGYGLSAALVESMQPTPQLIVTVDNGVASVAGVAAASARGIKVIVTDHHLPGEQLPAADAMVNPNLVYVDHCRHSSPPCEICAHDAILNKSFPSKALAGVGVMFYLLLALRARLRELGTFGTTEPDLSVLLDLVALGTVADLVPLDFNNRVLVEAGLKRIRSGRACAGITAGSTGRHAPGHRVPAHRRRRAGVSLRRAAQRDQPGAPRSAGLDGGRSRTDGRRCGAYRCRRRDPVRTVVARRRGRAGGFQTERSVAPSGDRFCAGQ